MGNRGRSTANPGDPLSVPYSRLRVNQFWHILVTTISDREWIRNRLSIAAISVQKSGPVNSQRSVRDSRAIMGESLPPHRLSGIPTSRSLISAKNAAILAHFSLTDNWAGVDPEICHPYPRIGSRKREPLIPNDCAAISGNSWGLAANPPPIWATLFLGPTHGYECLNFGTF